jgi:hypothetical protein
MVINLSLDIELRKKDTQTGTISISATPWATVIDRRKNHVGTSPILNHTIGCWQTMTVIFRHPDFADVTKTISIKFNESSQTDQSIFAKNPKNSLFHDNK